MSLPKKLKEKHLTRFDKLISEGQRIVSTIEVIPPRYDPNYTDINGHTRPAAYIVNASDFMKWRTSCASLLDQILPKNHVHRKTLEGIWKVEVCKGAVHGILSIVQGIHDDFDNGMLDALGEQIEAEISGDYMGQAEELLKEG